MTFKDLNHTVIIFLYTYFCILMQKGNTLYSKINDGDVYIIKSMGQKNNIILGLKIYHKLG